MISNLPNFGSMQQFWIEFKKFFFQLLVRFLRLEMWYACQKLRETILCNQPKKDLTRREQPERETELRFPIIAPAPVEWQEGPPRSERGKAARMQDLLRANRPAIRSGKMHPNLTRGSSNQIFHDCRFNYSIKFHRQLLFLFQFAKLGLHGTNLSILSNLALNC